MFVIFLISECIMAKMKYTEKHRNSDILPDNENMLFLDRINLNKNIDIEKRTKSSFLLTWLCTHEIVLYFARKI